MTDRVVAVIGLGQMGRGIAASYVRAGRTVLGVDPVSRGELDGVERVALDEAAQRADTLVLSLPGSDQVREVLTGPGGLTALPVREKLVIDTSTSHPRTTRELAAELGRHGHLLVDAPVSGGPSGARQGELTVFLGCPDGELGTVEGELGPMAGRVIHVGDVGYGHTAKLANNLLVGSHLAAAREAWRLATSTGVDPDRLFDAINQGSGRSAVTEVNIPRWVLSGAYDSGFPVRLMARDVALATQVATEGEASVPLARAVTAEWSGLLERVDPDTDFNRMVTST